MGNVTPGDMRAIIQSQENGAPGGVARPGAGWPALTC